jgi:hypothetical protein
MSPFAFGTSECAVSLVRHWGQTHLKGRFFVVHESAYLQFEHEKAFEHVMQLWRKMILSVLRMLASVSISFPMLL